MRASLYEALGIPPTASDEEVRAALRRLIRKYYAKTRDGQGNVEEALRFINHASRILSDPDRRIRYNGELARSGDSVPAEVQQAALSALAATGEGTDVAGPVADSAGERVATPPRKTRSTPRATFITPD
jgi:curved DNA-binding protein CbpA